MNSNNCIGWGYSGDEESNGVKPKLISGCISNGWKEKMTRNYFKKQEMRSLVDEEYFNDVQHFKYHLLFLLMIYTMRVHYIQSSPLLLS